MASAANTTVAFSPMLNAAPGLRISWKVMSPPRIFGGFVGSSQATAIALVT